MTLHQVIRELWFLNKGTKNEDQKQFAKIHTDKSNSHRFTSLYGTGGDSFWEAVSNIVKADDHDNIWVEFGLMEKKGNNGYVNHQLAVIVKGRWFDEYLDRWIPGKTWQEWDKEIKSGEISMAHNYREPTGMALPRNFVMKNCKGCGDFAYFMGTEGEYQSVYCYNPKEECKKAALDWEVG